MKQCKPKPCDECKTTFQPHNSLQVVCSPNCALKRVKRRQEAKVASTIKKERKAQKQASTRAKRDLNRKNIRWQHKQTQKAFNKLRVAQELKWFEDRGLEPTCISCGKPKGNDQWCCGHFKSRGAQSGLRYDPKNTYLQHNQRCNMRLSADIEGTKTTRGYKKGLIERFGEVEGQAIIDYCEVNVKPVDWDWEELEKQRAGYNKLLRQIEGR
jgi:hypothetical protein